MAFDALTRNRLANFVKDARDLITEEFFQKFKELYGINESGQITPLEKLTHLDEVGRATAVLLRERIKYLTNTQPLEGKGKSEAVSRLVREQAFTVLNRLAAIRMAEKRGLIPLSVGKGYQSDGFRVYDMVAGKGLGEVYQRYRRYLFCLFDELAIDLGVLFSRHTSQSLLFPREKALQALFELLNAHDLDPLWAEDETIGWIYQYYNDPLERKKMREESSAPRNSRELAVRNQFFTPRYVVEFLTDNTLGRIWYEMTQGNTSLKEKCRYLVRRPNEIFLKPGETAPEHPKQDNVSQEDLLKQPVHIPHRPLKDPRTILMLDPACGSMHFGLYAFDLLEVIYDEAWTLEEKLGADALSRPPGMKSLHETYTGMDAFLKDVPRLIIENNLHGIDIDPRCAQIAGLSLWLRAQKAWQRLGLKPAERPAIKRSNIVCAEPMPGDKELLRQFVDNEFPVAERAVCLRLLEAIFDKMQLAGEAGSLLKIEEEIRSVIEDAKKKWKAGPKMEQSQLFGGEKLKQQDILLDYSGLTESEFWDELETKIYAALRDYAEQAENSGGFQRRLFAEDAARGFAFIDVCRKRYDVALMNPPFGAPTDLTDKLIKDSYPISFYDIYAAFVVMGCNRVYTTGFVGAITSKTFFATTRLLEFRVELMMTGKLATLVDLGMGVLDNAMVETASYVIRRDRVVGVPLIFNVMSEDDRGIALLNQVKHFQPNCYALDVNVLLEFPNSPLAAYWAGSALLKRLTTQPRLDPVFGETAAGQATGNDFRYVRAAWEISGGQAGSWRPFAKGGDYSRYLCDLHLVVDWSESAINEFKKLTIRSVLISKRRSEFDERRALVWSRVNKGFNVRALPQGALFADKAPAIFCDQDSSWLLGYLSSGSIDLICALQNPNRMFELRDVSKLPVPEQLDRKRLTALASENHACKAFWAAKREPNTRFTLPVLFTLGIGQSIRDAWSRVCELASSDRRRLIKNHSVIDQIVKDALFLSDEVVERMRVTVGSQADDPLFPDGFIESDDDALPDVVAEHLSHALGVAFGRWDIRYATGEQAAPELPDPFAPLPVCPPGQLQNAQGFPARPEDVPAAYPVRIPWDGILVDDPNHLLDIERRVREVIEIIWNGQDGGPTAEAIEHEACEILGVKSLRDYFRKPAGFFADHLKRYSKSRRQAPIYWPLSTASGSYTLWIYYHRLTDQTLHSAIADFLDPKIKATGKAIDEARNKKRGAEVSELSDLLDELNQFREEIELVIKLPWKPNLNDGVLITACPLWRLFRHGKWQKDLKACWAALFEGEYDWAQLAYSIWPDRVRDKCKADRSLAIAHNLEELCKEKDGAKKTKRIKN